MDLSALDRFFTIHFNKANTQQLNQPTSNDQVTGNERVDDKADKVSDKIDDKLDDKIDDKITTKRDDATSTQQIDLVDCEEDSKNESDEDSVVTPLVGKKRKSHDIDDSPPSNDPKPVVQKYSITLGSNKIHFRKSLLSIKYVSLKLIL